MRRVRFHILAVLGVSLLAGCLGNVRIRPVRTFAAIDYGLPEKYVTLGGVRLCYVDEGKGDDVLVFLPPSMSSLKVWRDAIAELRARYRVIALDLPGFGKSDKPRRLRYHPDTFAQVTARLLDHLRVGNATLIGNSNGGGTALAFALRYPERIRRLVLVSPSGVRGAAPWQRRLARWLVTPMHVGTSNPHATRLALHWRAWGKTGPRTDEYLSDLLSIRGAGEEYQDWLRAQVKVIRANVAFDLSARLGEVKAPTLIVWGDRDGLLPVELARRLHKAVRGSELTILPGVGHMPELEVPEALNRIITGFLQRTAATPARAAPAAPAPKKPDEEKEKEEKDEEGSE